MMKRTGLFILAIAAVIMIGCMASRGPLDGEGSPEAQVSWERPDGTTAHCYPYKSPKAYQKCVIGGTKIVEIEAGSITYILQRSASGGDTIGYSDANFRTIAVDRASGCYWIARVGHKLPKACVAEAR